MNLQKLFELQQALNDRIVAEHNLKGDSLLPKQLLALHVELGELANKTNCFKYWSNKVSSDKSIILEEYVDCLKFILTIGLHKKYNDIEISSTPSEYNLIDQFLNLYIDVNDLLIASSKDHYITLFEDFLSLGVTLGFSENDIEDSYLIKNSKHFE